MEFPKSSSKKIILFGGVLLAFIAIYPNIGYLIHDLREHNIQCSDYFFNIGYFFYRFIFFWLISSVLLYVNIVIYNNSGLPKRLRVTFLYILAAYLIYTGIAHLINRLMDCFGSTLIMQFIVVWIISGLIGHIYMMSLQQLKIKEECERLKTENLRSRYEALSNQINPHFFFNSLSGLTSLMRDGDKESALNYTGKLSNVFRYILQSEKKGLVTLKEELHFLEAYRYLLEIRYAGKLLFHIDVNESDRNLLIPALSLLPLIENVVKHNIIDSEHPMDITIEMNDPGELVISNPIRKKIFEEEIKTGIGLSNLSGRFLLLSDKQIRVTSDNGTFRVFLPITKE